MKATRDLAALRTAIDALDSDLMRLLSQRAGLALEVGKVKRAAGDTQFYRPEREAAILRRIMAENPGPLAKDTVAFLFREIISACLALESPLRVAYLGPAGTFSQMAAQKHFGTAVELQPSANIAEIFRLVDGGQAHFGVVPVENSSEGSVNQTLDLLLDYPLRICGEVQLRVVHNLVSSGAPLAALQRIHVHYQTRAQCREWLADHLPGVELMDAPSNAVAAQRAAADPESGAISTHIAAELHGLQILAAGIEDNPENTTRFLVIGGMETQPSGADKTSLVVAAPNRPGSLHALLSPLAAAGISLTRIESRPTRSAIWEYVFYLDLQGHCQDAPIAAALRELADRASFYRCLGAYPKAVY